MLSAQTFHEGARPALYRQSMLICCPKILLSVIRKGTDLSRDFRKETEDDKRRSLGPSFILLKNVGMLGKLQICLCLFVSIPNLLFQIFTKDDAYTSKISESKEGFAIQKYLLIIRKKQNMHVLSNTFTYFSTLSHWTLRKLSYRDTSLLIPYSYQKAACPKLHKFCGIPNVRWQFSTQLY